MSWAAKPKGLDEHAWYREIEKSLLLTVISADADDGTCPQCGQRRVIYQAQSYPDRVIVARCKDCCLALAGRAEGLWVRTEAALRKKWERDGKDPALQRRARLAQQRRVRGAGSGSAGRDEF